MKFLLIALSLFAGVAQAAPSATYLCSSADGVSAFTDSSASVKAAQAAVLARCQGSSEDPAACAKPACRAEAAKGSAKLVLQSLTAPKCDSDDDCPGFMNSCFMGQCRQEGYQCDSDDDCPGFMNNCFMNKCSRQEPLCDSDDDCPGFMNNCFMGKCTNP